MFMAEGQGDAGGESSKRTLSGQASAAAIRSTVDSAGLGRCPDSILHQCGCGMPAIAAAAACVSLRRSRLSLILLWSIGISRGRPVTAGRGVNSERASASQTQMRSSSSPVNATLRGWRWLFLSATRNLNGESQNVANLPRGAGDGAPCGSLRLRISVCNGGCVIS
jgi:hypothetical protein